MALAAQTRWAIRRYWADRFGVPPEAFEEAGVTVGPADEGGVQLFCSDGAWVIGAPDALFDACRQHGTDLVPLDTDDYAGVQAWFTDLQGIERVIGPTFYGYTDQETFDPVESEARVLTAADEPAYEAFRADIPNDEWAQGGPAFTPDETVGFVIGDELVAASGYDVWDGLIAHLAVVTHPDNRDEGYGQAVVSHATEQALAAGLIPQYRTLDAWPWSVAVAQRLGFKRFATAYLGVDRA